MKTAPKVNRMTPTPVRTPRTRRNHELQIVTSMKAGKSVPIAAIPMLREESLSASMQVTVEMQETNELLMNGVDLRITAYLVPNLAFERFDGSRDQLDRSYAQQPKVDGGATVPFLNQYVVSADGVNQVHKYLGHHVTLGELINGGYTEAYNVIYNYRARNRSKNIPLRPILENATLAPAFWNHSQFAHIVPDFDQAVLDGEVALSYASNKIAVRGLSTGQTAIAAGTSVSANQGGAVTNLIANQQYPVYGQKTAVGGAAGVWAEMADGGLTISLSNIELARKTQAFAALRAQYEGLADDYIIDMLMDGLTIPDQAMKFPILIADKLTRFGQAKRYATNAGSLSESAVSGGAVVNLNLRVPRNAVGGVVMVIAEAVPQQLFERQKDWYLYSTDVTKWPEFVRDELDPEKVDVVLNGAIDTAHTNPNGVFGYEPLNARFNRAGPKVGGKFFRPGVNTTTDTDRQIIWAVEDINPILSESFYVVKGDMHLKPFLDTLSDPFEVAVVGNGVLEGNTVFGGMLVEATNNYDKIEAQAPVARIVKPVV